MRAVYQLLHAADRQPGSCKQGGTLTVHPDVLTLRGDEPLALHPQARCCKRPYSPMRDGLRQGHVLICLSPPAHSPNLVFPRILAQSVDELVSAAVVLLSSLAGDGLDGFFRSPGSSRRPGSDRTHVRPAISSCSPSLLSYPSRLALARAETLRPAPPAALLRAHPARPSGFGSPGNISDLSQTRLDEILPVPPKKHVRRLGSSSRSLFGCPSETGRKGVTDACISTA